MTNYHEFRIVKCSSVTRKAVQVTRKNTIDSSTVLSFTDEFTGETFHVSNCASDHDIWELLITKIWEEPVELVLVLVTKGDFTIRGKKDELSVYEHFRSPTDEELAEIHAMNPEHFV